MRQRRILTLGLALVALTAGAVGIALAGGTSLGLTFGDPVITCNEDGQASVKFSYVVTSTGAADAAIVSATMDGTDLGTIQTIASGNANNGGGWTFAGSLKTADGSYSASLENGGHTFTVCATQAGAAGNPDKTACESQVVTVDCASEEPCANEAVFGEVPANRNLCKANGHIEIQFRGDFGETATLEVSGPSAFTRTFDVTRAGDSCNYHENWDPKDTYGNGGAGAYSFIVNGSDLTFSADLTCDEHGQP